MLESTVISRFTTHYRPTFCSISVIGLRNNNNTEWSHEKLVSLAYTVIVGQRFTRGPNFVYAFCSNFKKKKRFRPKANVAKFRRSLVEHDPSAIRRYALNKPCTIYADDDKPFVW